MTARHKNLSLSKTVKLGVSSVGAKPVRFAITIVLFVFCLSIVGWSFTVLFADPASAMIKAYRKADTEEAFVKVRPSDAAYDKNLEVETRLTEEEAENFRGKNPGFSFDTIYDFNASFMEYNLDSVTEYYSGRNFRGCVEIDTDFLSRYDYKLLAGRLPANAREAVIPEYVFEIYAKYGYRGSAIEKTEQYRDVLGKKFTTIDSTDVEIVGVLDTRFRGERFELLKKRKQNLREDEIDAYEKQSSLFEGFVSDGFQTALFVHKDFIRKFVTKEIAHFAAESIVSDFGAMPISVKIGEILPYGAFLDSDRNFINVLGTDGLSANDVILPKSYLTDYLKKAHEAEEDYAVTDEKIRNFLLEGYKIPMSFKSSYFEIYDLIDFVPSEYRAVGYYEDIVAEGDAERVVSDPYFIVSDEKFVDTVGNIAQKPIVFALASRLSDRKSEDKNLLRCANGAIDENRTFTLGGIVAPDRNVVYTVNGLGKSAGWIPGAVMAVFSALMMFNFISATISAKQKDIGILRAIGTTNRTVYLIFASESLFTAIFSFLISIFGSIGLCVLTNALLPFSVGYFWFLSYGIGEALLVLLIGAAIALVGSLIPILKLLRKKPMEILR